MNNLFSENSRVETPEVQIADTKNCAGGSAYRLSSQAALAQYVTTGVLNATYNTDAKQQQENVLVLARESDPEFIARLAVYARRHGQMKDTPAFLVAYLAHENTELCKKVFSRVIDTPKMLRNFVSFMRSGAIGRKSLGSAPKKLVQNYLASLTDEQVFRANVGNKPSLRDILRMSHPAAGTKEREALYRYIVGNKLKEEDGKYLLSLAQEYEAFKKDTSRPVPNVPFEMLTALPLSEDNWKTIARNCSFNQARQNLATFDRHGVFRDPEMVKFIAAKLSNAEEVRRSRTLPYQLLVTYLHTTNIDQRLRNALQEAVEVSLENVPAIEGDVAIALDVSQSMTHRVTGNRNDNASVIRYIDIASLFAAAIIRKNKHAELIPFNTAVQNKDLNINPHDSVMTNAEKLRKMANGGTDCSVSLAHLNKRRAKLDSVIYVSDNESWQHYNGRRYRNSPTGMMEEWASFRERNPNAKLVNIDISPSTTNQMPVRSDVLLVGGFSDFIFDIIAGFMRGSGEEEYWLKTIGEIRL